MKPSYEKPDYKEIDLEKLSIVIGCNCSADDSNPYR